VTARADGDGPAGPATVASTARSAGLVATGIFLSRIAGLVRERVFAHYFGTSLYASAFRGALRMPNVLQNLLGEGTLSASFIPVYAGLLERGEREAAGRLAGAVFALLLAVAGALVLAGIALAPVLVRVFMPGFSGELYDATVALVRVLLPMTGILVLSAWALGILNSHRSFFLPYVAPVVWNGAMIAVLLALGGQLAGRPLVVALAWGALAGGVLQFLVQLPRARRLEPGLRLVWDVSSAPVRQVLRNAGPAILGRGSVQLGTWLDLVLVSFLFTGAYAALGYAQTLYVLPISLFGLSVAAAELPEMARRSDDGDAALADRLRQGLRGVALLVVPSTIGYIVLGDVIVDAIYRTGAFTQNDTRLVTLALAAYALGLPASTASRLYGSAFYARNDTRTPAVAALVRVVAAAGLGLGLMTALEPWSVRAPLTFAPTAGSPVTDGWRPLGVVGLALASGVAAWIEWGLVRRAAVRRIGPAAPGAGFLARLLLAAAAAGGAGLGIAALTPALHPVLRGAAVLAPFAVVYFLILHLLGVPEVGPALRRLRRRVGR
jgi:putative peptidoglycan lipid II flippase